jgi:hypothetical protein
MKIQLPKDISKLISITQQQSLYAVAASRESDNKTILKQPISHCKVGETQITKIRYSLYKDYPHSNNKMFVAFTGPMRDLSTEN